MIGDDVFIHRWPQRLRLQKIPIQEQKLMDKDELERRKRRKKISYRSIDCMNASGVGVARTRDKKWLKV